MALKKKKGIGIIIIASIVMLIGVIGCVFCAGGIISVRNFKLDLPETTRITSAVKGGLDSATTLIKNLSVALRNGSKTVGEAKDSLYNVKDIVDNTSNSVYSIADTMDFNIFGFQPLSGASEYFNKLGINIEELGATIIEIAENIDVNKSDVEKIADNLNELAIKLKNVSENFGSSTFTLPDFGFKKVLYSVFIFAGILSVAFILIGIGLILINKKINLYS